MPSSIYIHFPYCLYKCHYCDFNSYATDPHEIPHRDFVSALLAELKWRLEAHKQASLSGLAYGEKVSSVFFGGGTPSLMRPQDVKTIIYELRQCFALNTDVEITLETNPGTVSEDRLQEFCQAGINRVSLGVQSLNDAYLKKFGRIHTAAEAYQTLKTVYDFGGVAVSADMIFGFPGQSLLEWEADLDQLLTIPLDHVSCYALTAEPQTRYATDLHLGRYEPADAEMMAEMMTRTQEFLASRGLECYEISNYAREGCHSVHNLGYWNFQPYLGLGPGAVSQAFSCEGQSKEFMVTRTTSIKSPQSYLKTAGTQLGVVAENISTDTAAKEFVMMGLRLSAGLDTKRFSELFGQDFSTAFGKALEQALQQQWVSLEKGFLKPTQAGQMLNNQLVSLFF